MISVINQLKKVEPDFTWYCEKEIEDAILYLEEKGFIWQKSKKIFYHQKLEIKIYPKEIKEIINNNGFLERRLLAKKKDTAKELRENIRVASYLINFLIFSIIMNLFLGWIVLHVVFWIFLEVILVTLLISFVKIRKKIKSSLYHAS
jgi:hypothetical protein